MSENDFPRILFLTVNGWNDTTGTGTITSIIKNYPSDKVANIFIRPDIPNSTTCDRYFRIDEIRVFKSIFKRSLKTGYEIQKNISETDNEAERTTQNILKRYRNVFTPFLRDLAWKLGKWKTEELENFILSFDPDVVIYPVEALIHFNNIGMYISKLIKKKTCLLFWDDNFTYKSVSNPISKIYRFLQRKNIKKVVRDVDFAFSWSPKMQQELLAEMGVASEILTRPIVDNKYALPYSKKQDVIRILYTGSIYIGRGETILALIEAVKNINEHKKRIFLEIYTNSNLTEKEKSKYNVNGVSALFPPVKKDEVVDLQKEADILLFVESLKGKYRNAARLSFSTKITDYLSARRCILAIGPHDIAPMEYLKDNDIALTASNEEQIQDILKRILKESDLIYKYAEKSYNFGRKYHNQQHIYDKFCAVLKEKCS